MGLAAQQTSEQPTVNVAPELVSVKTLSRMLDLKERTLRELVAQRKIPFFKIGRLVRFNLEDIRAWYRKNLVSPKAVQVVMEGRTPYGPKVRQ